MVLRYCKVKNNIFHKNSLKKYEIHVLLRPGQATLDSIIVQSVTYLYISLGLFAQKRQMSLIWVDEASSQSNENPDFSPVAARANVIPPNKEEKNEKE